MSKNETKKKPASNENGTKGKISEVHSSTDIPLLGRIPTISEESGYVFLSSSANGKYYTDTKESGIYFVANGNDIDKAQRICDWLYVKYRFKGVHGNNYGMALQFKEISRKALVEIPLMNKDLTSKATKYLQILLDHGFNLEERGPNCKGSISDYIRSLPAKDWRFFVNKMGWHTIEGKSVYILPTGETLGMIGDNKVVYHPENDDEGLEPAPKGTLKEWQENVSKYALFSDMAVLAICASFAGPLLEFIPSNVTNSTFHFLGGSSSGKSTVMRLSASVSRYVDKLPTWNKSATNIETALYKGNDSIVIIDELGQARKFEDVCNAIYTIGNGIDRGRSNVNLTQRNSRTWKTLVLSSGEIGLKEVFRREHKSLNAGQEIRFLEIQADEGKGYGIFKALPEGFESSLQLVNAVNENVKLYYGVALKEYIEAILRILNADDKESYPRDSLVCLFGQLEDEFLKVNTKDDYTAQIKRASTAFGLLAIAGTLASGGFNNYLGVNITGWNGGGADWTQGDAFKSVSSCFQQWITNFGDPTKSKEYQEVVRDATALIFDEPCRYVRRNEEHVPQLPYKFLGYHDNLKTFYIRPDDFKNKICKPLGKNEKELKKILFDEKILKHPQTQSIRIKHLNNLPTKCLVFERSNSEKEMQLNA